MTHAFTGFVSLVIICGLAGYAECTNCPNLWTGYNGECYLFGHGSSYHFVEAEAYCRQHNGHLVEVHSWTENLFVKDAIRGYQGYCYWSGLTDKIEGLWKWYNSQITPSVTNWGPGEPNSCDGDEACVMYVRDFDYRWADVPCTAVCFPVCKLDVCGIIGR